MFFFKLRASLWSYYYCYYFLFTLFFVLFLTLNAEWRRFNLHCWTDVFTIGGQVSAGKKVSSDSLEKVVRLANPLSVHFILLSLLFVSNARRIRALFRNNTDNRVLLTAFFGTSLHRVARRPPITGFGL